MVAAVVVGRAREPVLLLPGQGRGLVGMRFDGQEVTMIEQGPRCLADLPGHGVHTSRGAMVAAVVTRTFDGLIIPKRMMKSELAGLSSDKLSLLIGDGPMKMLAHSAQRQ